MGNGMPPKRRNARSIAACVAASFAFICLMLTPSSCGAQVTDCDEISQNSSDKIVMDKVSGVDEAVSGMTKVSLENMLDMQFAELHQTLRNFAQFVFCGGRYPQTSAPFDPSRTEFLHDHGVTIEVWGEIDQTGAILNFLLVPVRHYEFFGHGNEKLSGYEIAQYKPLKSDRIHDVRLGLFGKSLELKALSSVGLGVNYFKRAKTEEDSSAKTKLYDDSRSFFCRGVVLLNQARPTHPNLGLNPVDWTTLADYAGRSAVSVADAAINDDGYKGSMKITLSNGRPRECPGPAL